MIDLKWRDKSTPLDEISDFSDDTLGFHDDEDSYFHVSDEYSIDVETDESDFDMFDHELDHQVDLPVIPIAHH